MARFESRLRACQAAISFGEAHGAYDPKIQEKKSIEMSLVEAIEHDGVQTESRKGDVVL